jgi:PadR family transcriptional regulator PadR
VESNSGPPRKYYTLTQAGLDFLASLQNTWNELVASTGQIMSRNENNGQSKVPPIETPSKDVNL